MGKKSKEEVETVDAALAESGVKKKKKDKKLDVVVDAVADDTKSKLSKEEKAAKKAAKAAKEAAPVRESPRLAAAKAAQEVPDASLDAVEEEEEETGFKVHKYVPPAEPEDETLQCRDCNGDFVFTVGEQEFFKQKGFTNKKTRCADCTAAKKERFGEGGGKGDGGKGKGKGKGKGDKGGKGGAFTCYNCGEEGHRSSDCEKPRSSTGGGGGGGVCYAFQKGECSRGEACRFSH